MASKSAPRSVRISIVDLHLLQVGFWYTSILFAASLTNRILPDIGPSGAQIFGIIYLSWQQRPSSNWNYGVLERCKVERLEMLSSAEAAPGLQSIDRFSMLIQPRAI